MKCKCCGTEIDYNVSVCPACAMPTLSGSEGQELEKMISDYKKSLIGDSSVWIRIFRYRTDNIDDPVSEIIELADAGSMNIGDIYWCDMEFEKLESEREFEIEIFIRKDSAENPVKISVRPPKSIPHSRIGVSMEEGFNIRLVIGEKDNYITSDAVSLIN